MGEKKTREARDGWRLARQREHRASHRGTLLLPFPHCLAFPHSRNLSPSPRIPILLISCSLPLKPCSTLVLPHSEDRWQTGETRQSACAPSSRYDVTAINSKRRSSRTLCVRTFSSVSLFISIFFSYSFPSQEASRICLLSRIYTICAFHCTSMINRDGEIYRIYAGQGSDDRSNRNKYQFAPQHFVPLLFLSPFFNFSSLIVCYHWTIQVENPFLTISDRSTFTLFVLTIT